MPIESAHPPITVPAVDAWQFFFERADRDFPDDHGKSCVHPRLPDRSLIVLE